MSFSLYRKKVLRSFFQLFILIFCMAQVISPAVIFASTPTPTSGITSSPTDESVTSSPSVSPSLTPDPTETATPTPDITSPPASPTPSEMPSPLITHLTVSNGKDYAFSELQPEALIFIDREYRFTGDITELLGSQYLQTANDDKLSMDTSWISFGLSRPAFVYIAHDSRIIDKPDWLNSFTDTGADIRVFNADHDLYVQFFDTGEVMLGGNKQPGDTKRNTSMYSVFIVDVEDVSIPMPTPPIIKGPQGSDIGPALPVCEPGQEIASFGTYTLANSRSDIPDLIDLELNVPAFEAGTTGVLKVLQGEGHNWDRGFDEVSGPKNKLPSDLSSFARQFQSDEVVEFYWGTTTDSFLFIGEFVDHSPEKGKASTDRDNITTEYSFNLGELTEGRHYLRLRHNQEEKGPQSVFVKGVICRTTAAVTPPPDTPTPTLPAPSETPVPTVTPTPEESPTPTPSEPVPACIEGPGHASVLIDAVQGTQKNLMPIPLYRSNPLAALGPVDGTFFSVGVKGTITVQFERPVIDIPGTDLVLYETTWVRQTYMNELAEVEVSEDGVSWYLLPELAGNRKPFSPFGATSFDISSTGLEEIRFVRLTDASNYVGVPYMDADGYDFDSALGIVLGCED